MNSLRRTSLLATSAGSVLAVAALGLASTGTTAAGASRGPVAHAAAAAIPCPRPPGPLNANRPTRKSNPLDLTPAPPAGANDPIQGAPLTVAGPYIPLGGNNAPLPRPAGYNYAGSEIVRMLGLTNQVGPERAITPRTSWTQFETDLAAGGKFHNRLMSRPAPVRSAVNALALLASQPTPNKVTVHAGNIHAQARKVFCQIAASDPGLPRIGSVPVIVTYFLHPELHNNATAAQMNRFRPNFERQIRAVTSAIGRRRAIVLAEIDGLGSSQGFLRNQPGPTARVRRARGQAALETWESLLRYEVDQFERLPRTAVYVEGGYSDSNGVGYTAKALAAVGVGHIQGFFTNDTHNQWTSHEVIWARAIVSRLRNRYHVPNVHFIVNTSDNGLGPRLNPYPVEQGVEDNCNPNTTAIGIPPTTFTGVSNLDAYLWTHPPGTSAGDCVSLPRGNGGYLDVGNNRALCRQHRGGCQLRTFPGAGQSSPTANGAFWPNKAVSMVARANAQFGPPRNYPPLPRSTASLRVRLQRQNQGNRNARSRPYGNRARPNCPARQLAAAPSGSTTTPLELAGPAAPSGCYALPKLDADPSVILLPPGAPAPRAGR